jgi:hypothetical protein
MTPCSVVRSHQHLGITYCLDLQPWRWFLRNIRQWYNPDDQNMHYKYIHMNLSRAPTILPAYGCRFLMCTEETNGPSMVCIPLCIVNEKIWFATVYTAVYSETDKTDTTVPTFICLQAALHVSTPFLGHPQAYMNTAIIFWIASLINVSLYSVWMVIILHC